jgi:hypothetical protein
VSSESGGSAVEPLACPTCARRYPLTERFCAECGMPLVYVGRREEEPVTASHERARKVKPQYADGEPVKIAYARNQAEAELIQGLLLEEGIPSFECRTRGFDVPDFLAAGPRDVLVPRSGAEAARELLGGEEATPPAAAIGDGDERPVRLLVGILAALAVGALVVWALFQLLT